jgi:predicted deacylase
MPNSVQPPHAVPVEALDVESLAPNKHHRLTVHLSDDAMGRPIRVPLLVARGRRPGPVFGLCAALHGNELNGIPVLHRLFKEFDTERMRGTVVGVVVANVPGYLRHQREFNDGADLNHLFPGVEGGNMSQMYASRLFERVVRRFDAMIDLHTASFGRINCLYIRADLTNPDTALMAYRLRPQIILHNPPSDRTLRGAAQALGIPSITLEIGNPHRFQDRYIRQSRLGILTVLGDAGVLPKRRVTEGPPPILCDTSRWVYTDRGGLLRVLPDIMDRVDAQEKIAVQTNVFGDTVRTYLAPGPGIVIGRSHDPVGQAGARILHLGTIAADESKFVPRPSAT